MMCLLYSFMLCDLNEMWVVEQFEIYELFLSLVDYGIDSMGLIFQEPLFS